jgi:hypothetical protein
MVEDIKKENNIFLYLLLGGCLIAIAVSFYFFYFKKDYEFIVETSCDPSKETCIQRDCSNPDDCPPNGFTDFKRYSLNAGDFDMCENEDCTKACETKAIQCTQIECVEDEIAGESCSVVEEKVDGAKTEENIIQE